MKHYTDNKTVILIAVIAALTSCVKVELHRTDHPDGGKIIALRTDWTYRASDVAVPDSYDVRISNNASSAGNWEGTLSGASNSVTNLFPAGQYHINIWNSAEHITVSGTTAAADYSSPPDGDLLGWFFTGVADQSIEADRDYTVDVAMRQQVRCLTLVLNVAGDAADRVTGITATLSGVADAIDIDTGNAVGNAVTVALIFAKGDDGKYYATIRLLGVAGSEQHLTATLTYAEGNPSSQTVVCDLSNPLAAFNADKKTPLTLNAQAIVTTTATGFSATVDEWAGEGGTIIAN